VKKKRLPRGTALTGLLSLGAEPKIVSSGVANNGRKGKRKEGRKNRLTQTFTKATPSDFAKANLREICD